MGETKTNNIKVSKFVKRPGFEHGEN